jgi:hypothetical protein
MTQTSWKDELRKHFEAFKLVEKAKADTLASFDEFREFIAEPAFENLKEEMKDYDVRVRFRKETGRSIQFELSFPRSTADNFHYRIVLPKNGYELRLGLVLRGRKMKASAWEEKATEFMKDIPPSEVMKIAKEDLIRDILERYRDFTFSAMTSPD